MKKMLSITLVAFLVLTISGCGKEVAESNQESKKEDVISTKTCTMESDAYDITFKFNAVNDKVDKVELIMAYDNKTFGVETLSDLTKDQKEAIKTSVLTTLGLDKEQDGLEAQVEIKDTMTVTVNADLYKAEEDAAKKAGIDVKAGTSLKRLVKELQEEDLTCN